MSSRNEGVALWVNGQQLVDNWTDHTLAEDSGSVVARTEGRKSPAPGQRVAFRVQPDDVFAFHPQTGARLAGRVAEVDRRPEQLGRLRRGGRRGRKRACEKEQHH